MSSYRKTMGEAYNGMYLVEGNIDKIKDIVSKKQHTKIDGVMVDFFTASAISQIYDKVNDANKEKIVQRVGTTEKFMKLMPKLFGMMGEGKSPHKKGTTKYKKHMAAMHAEAKDLARIKKLAGIEITEEEVTKDVIGHVDNESNMLRKELFKIGKDSIELYKMLDKLPEGDFPHWWQAKVVKSGEYISSAKGYLEAELYAPEEESPLDDVQDDDLNPSGV